MSDETFGGYTLDEWIDGEPYEDLRHGMVLAAVVMKSMLARAEKAEAERDDARRERAREIRAGQLGYTALAEFDYRNLPDGSVIVGGKVCRLEPCDGCGGMCWGGEYDAGLGSFIDPCVKCWKDPDGDPSGFMAVPVEADG